MTAAGRDESDDPSTGAAESGSPGQPAPVPGSVADEASLLVEALRRRSVEEPGTDEHSPDGSGPGGSAGPRPGWGTLITGLPATLRGMADVADLWAEGMRTLADALDPTGPSSAAVDSVAAPAPGSDSVTDSRARRAEVNGDESGEGSLVRSDSDGGKERA